jgi:CRISPR-associated endonuclease/helicase Cas3
MKLPLIKPEEFSDFFSKLHGRDAFDWQKRLAAEVAESGWPRALDLPTGSGKTAAIDIALYHLAVEADAKDRKAPLRIAFVVDRRVIVDAAYSRAVLIRNKLTEALQSSNTDGILFRVAQRLASFGGDPLLVRALRGGVPREDDWARTPAQPTVLCSTVDQVGSRLLFRGYGVSDSMKPVHAGLVGSDCLLLLDEAHLSEPFRQTLRSIEVFRKPPWTELPPAPWICVTLTATPEPAAKESTGPSDGRAFRLSVAERAEGLLARRLSASKPARLARVAARTNQPVAHAQAFAQEAWLLSGVSSKQSPDSPRAVAIVVNRVALARRCYQEIKKLIRSSSVDAEAVLFIGRARDVDRSRLMERYAGKIASEHSQLDKTLFVIATQCIEAGADFDFDALVTQIAPFDALRQRFGRLNRMGRDIPANAVIVAAPDELRSQKDDPLYADRARRTWEWLSAHAKSDVIDFGVNAMDAYLSTADVSLLTTLRRDGPVVMPAYVDLWAQTSPIPIADPEAALFLHGAPDAADVQIVWRADVEPLDFRPEARERMLGLLALMPPRAAETVAVPIAVARAWLSGNVTPPVNDVEGASEVEEGGPEVRAIPAFRWRGVADEESRRVHARDLRPGDVIIVPSTVGGCDDHGWDASGDSPVRDVADRAAQPYSRRRFVFRVHRALLEQEMCADLASADPEVLQLIDTVWRRLDRVIREARDANEKDASALALAFAKVQDLPPSWQRAFEAIADSRRARSPTFHFAYDTTDDAPASALVFVAPSGIDLAEMDVAEDEAVTDGDDAGSFRAVAVELLLHSKHVEDRARAFARAAGLTERLVEDLALAGFLHDEGKRDERFQLYLRRGDVLKAMLDDRILAKSGTGKVSRMLDAAARERSGLPERWRHEADSVRRALDHPKFKDAHDRLLVAWLIGTHHGYGRPFYPHTDPHFSGPQDLDFQIDGFDWRQIFTALLKRYGAWELARLEAIVRLADHRASGEEEHPGTVELAKIAEVVA